MPIVLVVAAAIAIFRLRSSKDYIRCNSSLNAIEFYTAHGFVGDVDAPLKSEYSVAIGL